MKLSVGESIWQEAGTSNWKTIIWLLMHAWVYWRIIRRLMETMWPVSRMIIWITCCLVRNITRKWRAMRGQHALSVGWLPEVILINISIRSTLIYVWTVLHSLEKITVGLLSGQQDYAGIWKKRTSWKMYLLFPISFWGVHTVRPVRKVLILIRHMVIIHTLICCFLITHRMQQVRKSWLCIMRV